MLRADTAEVKLGVASDVYSRLASLQIANGEPLKLLGVVLPEIHVSLRDLESAAHARFAPQRKRGEWFRFSQEMAAWIDRAVVKDPVTINGGKRVWLVVRPVGRLSDRVALAPGSEVTARPASPHPEAAA